MKTLDHIGMVLCLALLTSGCIYALSGRNSEFPVRLKIDSQFPRDYRVLVAGDELKPYYFDESGKVAFTIPPLGKGCRVYLLGVFKIADHSPSAKRATYVFENEEIIARLSIRDIQHLPLDSDGYRTLKTK